MTMTTPLIFILASCIGGVSNADAAEIKVLGTQSMLLVWAEVAATFEQQTGHQVVMTPHIATAAKRMIRTKGLQPVEAVAGERRP